MPQNRLTLQQQSQHGSRQIKNIRVGMINAATLNGKEEEVIMMMEEMRQNLLGIWKARVPGFGSSTIHDNYQLTYKSNNQERKYDMAIIMTHELAYRVEKINFVSERIISVTITFPYSKIMFIEVYTLHQGRSREEKEDFYQVIQDTIDDGPRDIIVMGI